MSFDSTATADTDVDQQLARELLQLIGFTVDGPLSTETVTVLDAYSKALAHAKALDSVVFSSHVIAQALVDVLASLKDKQVGGPVAHSLNHTQLVEIATPVFATKLETEFGADFAQGVKSHVLVEIVSKHFDVCVDRAIQKVVKQHLLDSLRQQLTEALTQPEHARFAPYIRRFLANLSEVEQLVFDDDSDVFSVLIAIGKAFQLSVEEEVMSRMGFGHDAHGHGHHGFVVMGPEDLSEENAHLGFPRSAFAGGFPRKGVVFDRPDRQGRHDF